MPSPQALPHRNARIVADTQTVSSRAGGIVAGTMPKAQHAAGYRVLPGFLRLLRERAGLTQRQLGQRIKRPQSWVYNCESGNRRVDVTEFAQWCRACNADPCRSFARLMQELPGAR